MSIHVVGYLLIVHPVSIVYIWLINEGNYIFRERKEMWI